MTKASIKKPKPNPKTGKINQVDTRNTINNDEKPPVFSFSEMIDNVFCINYCTNEEKISLLNKLRMLGNHTWRELKSMDRHKMGFEKISLDSIIGQNTQRQKDFLRENNYTPIAFRFYSMAPMVGYRDGQIFYILWLDRAFSLYKHN